MGRNEKIALDENFEETGWVNVFMTTETIIEKREDFPCFNHSFDSWSLKAIISKTQIIMKSLG